MKGEEIPKSGVVRLKYAKVNGVTRERMHRCWMWA